jgi:hypothetical protein
VSITFLITIFITISQINANEQIKAMKEMLNNPAFPEAQKAKIREGLKKYEQMIKKMESQTSFKSPKEWRQHYAYVTEKNKSDRDAFYEKEKSNFRKTYDTNYKIKEKASFKLNTEYRARLLSSKRFPKNIKEISNFDNSATRYHWTMEEMIINHMNAKLLEYAEKNDKAKDGQINVAIVAGMARMSGAVHAFSIDDINFLKAESKSYFKDYKKNDTLFFTTNARLRKEAASKLIQYIRNQKKPVDPPTMYREKLLKNRDYQLNLGETKGIFFSEPLAYKHYKKIEEINLKRFNHEENTRIAELDNLLKLSMDMMNSDYIKNNRKVLSDKIRSYKRKGIDRRVNDRLSNNNIDTHVERESALAVLKKWTESYVLKVNTKGVRFNTVYSKNQYWLGQLLSI